jgi:hypothetical protein
MSAALIYLVEITAYDPAPPGVRTLYFCSGTGKMTLPSETPANVHFVPRLQNPISFNRTMFANARVTGGGTVGTGEIVLNNADQGLSYLRDLGIDGRAVVVRVGPQNAAYPGGYTTFLTGTAEQVEVGAARVTIRLRDKLLILQQMVQATTYAGTNSLPAGVEGVAEDIKGQRKPLLFGRRYQIPPVQVNTSRLIYQFHDGTASAVDAVYDQGTALTFGVNRANLAAMEGTAPAAGAYDTCLSLGLIRLGASPAGRVTLDARGDATGGYVNKAGEIVQRILTQRCGITVGELDSATFTTLNAAATAECGIYITGETTRQAAIDLVLAGCGGWLSPSRAGLWQVGQLLAPTGSPAFSFPDVDILALDAIASRDAGAGVPIFEAKLQFKPYVEFGRADLAGGLTEARRAELLQSWRTVLSTDVAVQTTYLTAGTLLRETPLQDATQAATEAARVLALHKVRRDYVKARVALSSARAAVDLGAMVTLTTPRLGYGAGRNFIVVGIEIDGKRNRLLLDLWG